eukprot:6212518-Pleurochrysis_carterae.AAC.3
MEPSSSWKDKDMLKRKQDQISGQQACNCRTDYSGLYQEQRCTFQERGCSERGAMPTCILDDKCCNDALQAGLAQGR